MRRQPPRISFGFARFALGAAAFVLGTQTESSAQTGPYRFFAVTPCRLVDTRCSTVGVGAPGECANVQLGGPVLTGSQDRFFTAKLKCGVPSTAKAVAFNVTIVGPGNSGFLTLYPGDQARPNASMLNWAAGDVAIPNGAVVPLGAAASNDVGVYLGSPANAHLLLDVNGYFAP